MVRSKSGDHQPLEGLVSLSTIIYKVLDYIPGGCFGFLNHQQYDMQKCVHILFVCDCSMIYLWAFRNPPTPLNLQQLLPRYNCNHRTGGWRSMQGSKNGWSSTHPPLRNEIFPEIAGQKCMKGLWKQFFVSLK